MDLLVSYRFPAYPCASAEFSSYPIEALKVLCIKT